MLARIFVLIGGLIVLALFAALVGPYFINWSGYRADFEREAGAILGRPVKVNGEASARLIPFPSVTFTDVTVGGGADGTPSTTIEEFSMDAELAPFLSGEILIFDMRLVRPQTLAWVDPDGKFNWAVAPQAPVSPSQVALERVTVTDGQVRLVGHNMPDRILSGINLVASARTLAGPWRADGTLSADGHRMIIGMSTGIAGDDGLRVKLKAEPDASRAIFDLDGNVTTQAGALAYAGDFRVSERPASVEGLRDADGKPIAAAPGNRLSGKFRLDDKRLAVEEFRFETGPLDDPYVATGEGGMEFGRAPSFSVKAAGAQVRIGDDLVADEQQMTVAERIDQLEAAMLALPVPTIPGTVDIDLPAVVTGGTTIRDVALAAKTDGQGWEIARLSAKLPGRSTLEASGRLVTSPTPGFDGKMLLAISQPSGFANWLARDIEAPIRRLARAGFSADMKLTREAQVFDKMELALGSARFTGSAQRTAKPGERPVLSARLEGGAVGMDELTALRSLLFNDNGASRFADHEIDLAAKAGPVGAPPLAAGGVDAAVRIFGDAIEIDRLNVSDLAEASLAITGKVESNADAPKTSLDATVVAPDLAPLTRLAASLAPDNRMLGQLASNAAGFPELLTDARLDILAKAGSEEGKDSLALDIKGKAGGSDITAKVTMDGQRAKPLDAATTIDANFVSQDATGLMALAGIPSLPLGVVGPGAVTVKGKGALATGLETAIVAKANDAGASFTGTLLAPASGFQARGRASVEAADIEPWLMTAGVALPGMGAGLQTSLLADIDYANGLLVVSKLAGTVSENAVSGDLNVELAEGTPSITGALVMDDLDLEPFAEMVLGVEAFDAAGPEWPTTPFQQAAAASFKADLDINTATLSAAPGVTAYDAALSLKLDHDGLRIPKINARLGDGTLTGLFELNNSGATGLFSGQFKLAGAKLDRLLPLVGVEGAPLTGSTDVSGAISGSGKTVGAVVASLAGSGTVSVRDLVIGQINPAAFPGLIKAADGVGRDIDAPRVAGFAPPLLRTGSFAAGAAEIPFTVAGGVFRLPPASFGQSPMKLTADLKLDATTLDVQSSGELEYAPGDDALVGSEPRAGFSVAGKLGETALTIDTQPLAQFLTQRALEIEQARVEQMQAVLLEKQRLRRETRYYAALETERQKAIEEKRKAEEAARLAAVEEARLRAEEEARAAEEARKKAEDEARLKAEEEAKAAEEARLKAENEAKAAEQARLKAEEEARLKAEAQDRAAEEARKKAEAEAERRARAEQPTPETAPAEPERPRQAPAPRAEPARKPTPKPTAPGLF